ncbi:glycosyltransferase family 2 protein [Xylella taiwanensis]|uniref:Glycosyltransferase family 2 protein n=2 Tax=Xylella taiwanensis TaxID=1444770 RepID=Z9JGT2_9GAMM|nr:glycosyltransferase family A protein [Xylella taiwanensis]EWS77238.1 hypothetical protein AF72_12005 [Xylella taiwanensis]MCD8456745.1 glycosyltransferase family 2 protein [Xylella taiwanensis]MCD8459155.1 glycosyltransferase family 2 protein [Xylella taiwanensis]MCD8464243.1 glycosyltransferase family 2 protein [Xylella taiwanensis]MCD8465798.1 glycosyltransferase family 2 protein [Xylella taiwanensis]
MLDVHILTLPDTPVAWVQQRRAAIAAAVAQAGYRVVIHELPGIIGHIGRGRARGYRLGTQPYVTYIDDDDVVLPGAFTALGPALHAGHEAIAPGETTEQSGVRRRCPGPHHLICYQRSTACGFDHAAWRVCGDLAFAHTTRMHPVNDHSYVHRLYESPGRRLRRTHYRELIQAWGHG